LLSESQAARLLGVSPRTVFTLAAKGELPVVRIGSSKRYDPADLRKFIERAKTANEQAAK
jgi:excisionase family DNA binding protein